MSVSCWLALLLLSLCHQPALGKVHWMQRQFPCSVFSHNDSRITFECNNRRLKEVPDGITSNATELNLSDNLIKNLTDASFSKLYNLYNLTLNMANKGEYLRLEKNVFKNLTKLQKLKLSHNSLKKVPTNLPPSLTLLQLDGNKILHLNRSSFSGLTNLRELWVDKNCYSWNPCKNSVDIKNDTFSEMTKLWSLDVSYNNLSRVPKGLPPSLLTLKLASNGIQYIHEDDFHGLTNLKALHIQGNCPRCQNAPYPCVPCPKVSIQIHPGAFKDLTNLEYLNMGGNSLQVLNDTMFKNLRKLKKLLLAYNFLQKEITGDNGKFLMHLPKLTKVDFSFNFALRMYPQTLNMSRYFQNLTSLETLHVEGLVFQQITEHTLAPLYGLRNLSVLNLGTNFIVRSEPVFKNFTQVKMIYLAENRLYPLPVKDPPHPNYGYGAGMNFGSGLAQPVVTYPHYEDFPFEIQHELVKPKCYSAGRVLILSSNNLFFISPEQFDVYDEIACLNISGNGLSAALNGTEFNSKALANLTYLDLSYNKLNLAYSSAFRELRKLKVLDISHNAHYFTVKGVTNNLNFTRNLHDLQVLNMSYNRISTLSNKRMYSLSLQELQFEDNNLGRLWEDRAYGNLFQNLVNLTILDISKNQIANIPDWVYGRLPQSLVTLRISKNELTDFKWDLLKHFHQLKELDLSSNQLSYVTGLNATQNLTELLLSGNNIFQLDDGFLLGLKTLRVLDLSKNKLATINVSSLALDPGSAFQTLMLSGNPLECTCDALNLILWIEKTHVDIPELIPNVRCEKPVDQALILFDINQCVNDNQAFSLYILSNTVLVLFMVTATLANLFYWDASYVLHYVKAKLKSYRALSSTAGVYDVFVTYDTKDKHVSEWVMKNLRVKLEEEGEKHLPLCLEERDWVPGVPLVDNLIQSIRYSRKTMFVLTRGYVKTGVFRLAMYLAHQRLLDENVDVIVLLMLEPVLQNSHFLRLRRRLCGKSIIEWPKTAAAEPWFWQNLRNVIRVDNQVMYNKNYSKYFSNR